MSPLLGRTGRAIAAVALTTALLAACTDPAADKPPQEAAVYRALQRLANEATLTSSLQGVAQPGVPVRLTISLPSESVTVTLADVAPGTPSDSLPDTTVPSTTTPPVDPSTTVSTVNPTITLPTTTVPSPSTTAPAVPTTITVPSTIDPGATVTMPVSVSVEWKASTRGGPARTESFSRKEIVPLVSEFLFDPFLTDDLVGATPSSSINFVEPVLTLRTAPRNLAEPLDIEEQVVTRTFPRLEVETASIPLPRATFLFLHKDFVGAENGETGAVFVALPAQSPIGNDCAGLTDSIARVTNVARTLTALPRFASMVSGLDVLSSALNAQGSHVVCRAQNEFPDLNAFTLIERDIVTNNTEVEDEVSSMIYLGARSNQTIGIFNDRGFGTGGGSFTLSPGRTGIVRIPNLASPTPATEPASDLISNDPLLRVLTPPAGNRLAPPAAVVDFNEHISSLRYN